MINDETLACMWTQSDLEGCVLYEYHQEYSWYDYSRVNETLVCMWRQSEGLYALSTTRPLSIRGEAIGGCTCVCSMNIISRVEAVIKRSLSTHKHVHMLA